MDIPRLIIHCIRNWIVVSFSEAFTAYLQNKTCVHTKSTKLIVDIRFPVTGFN